MKNRNVSTRFRKFFTVFRILALVWNVIAGFYHGIWIGIDPWTCVVFQLTGLVLEWLFSYPYEKTLVYINDQINDRTRFVAWPQKGVIRFLGKSLPYLIVFSVLYVSTYFLRLELFYSIRWGINISELEQSMTNVLWSTIFLGPFTGFIVVWRKKRKRKTVDKIRRHNRLKIGP